MYGMGLAVGDLNNDNYPDFAVTDWDGIGCFFLMGMVSGMMTR